MSILALAEKVSGREPTPRRILELWFKNWQEGDIDIESTVQSPQGLLDDLPGDLEYVGAAGAEYVLKPGEYEILNYYNPRTGYEHFVLGDGEGNCEWDPLGKSVTVREGYVRGKRIYRKRRKDESENSVSVF